MKVNNKGYIVVTLKFRREGRKWTATCEELGTATFAYSLKVAQKRIEETILLHLDTLEKVGERARFFRENNITLYPHKPKKYQLEISGPFDPDIFVSPLVYPLSHTLSPY